MNVSLTRELERFIHDKVAGGTYHSASEVVREALRLLQQHDEMRQSQLARLRGDLDVGLQQINRGQTSPFNASRLKRRIADSQSSLRPNQRRKSA